jgi:hypothetical protein
MPASMKMFIGNYKPAFNKSSVIKVTTSQPCRGFNGSMIGRIHNAKAGCGCGK